MTEAYEDNQGNFCHEDYADKEMNIGDMPESFVYNNGEDGEDNIHIRYQLLKTHNEFADESAYARSNLKAFFSEAVNGSWRVYSVFDMNAVSSNHLETSNGHIGTTGFFGKSYDYDADISSVTGRNGSIPSYDEEVSGVNDLGDNLSEPSSAQEEATRAFCEELQEQDPEWGVNSIDDFRDTLWSVLRRGEVNSVSAFDDGSVQGTFSVYNRGSFYITARPDSLVICPTAEASSCETGTSGELVVYRDCRFGDKYTSLSAITQKDLDGLELEVSDVYKAISGKVDSEKGEANSSFVKRNLTKRQAK